MDTPEERKLAAIMFTDIVGYTTLTQRNEPLALELLHEHRRILRDLFPKFHGNEIETTGDGFLVEFASALEAARCAIEIQRALATRNISVPSERQIQLRIGIHVGDVVHKEGHVLGDGVNIAARLQPLAEPGGICISVDVARQVQHNLEATVIRVGEAELKNVKVPMEICRIVLPWERKEITPSSSSNASVQTAQTRAPLPQRILGLVFLGLCTLLIGILGWWAYHKFAQFPSARARSVTDAPSSAGNASKIPSIAVLRFRSLDGPAESVSGSGRFAQEITEQLITALSQIKGLEVKRVSGMFLSETNRADEIGHQLGAAFLLEGSVSIDMVNPGQPRQSRINVRLIQAVEEKNLWATNYDRVLTNSFAVQSEVAQSVAEAVRDQLLPAATAPALGFDGTEDAREIEKLKAILQRSPDLINTPAPSDGRTPLDQAAFSGRLAVAEFLLKNGAAVNGRSQGAHTALQTAVAGHKAAMAKLLVQHGASVNAKDATGFTALHVAASNGDLELAEFLLAHGAGVNYVAENGMTPLGSAAEKGQLEMVKALLEAGANTKQPTGRSSLAIAASRGFTAVAEALLAAGAEVNASAADGRTALFEAASNGYLEVAKLLLKHFANPNAGPVGITPLLSAISRKDHAMCLLLLQHGADPNLQGATGAALHAAVTVRQFGEKLELMKALLDYKADVNATNKELMTPLDVAISYPRWVTFADSPPFSDVQQFLEDHGGKRRILDMTAHVLRKGMNDPWSEAYIRLCWQKENTRNLMDALGALTEATDPNIFFESISLSHAGKVSKLVSFEATAKQSFEALKVVPIADGDSIEVTYNFPIGPRNPGKPIELWRPWINF